MFELLQKYAKDPINNYEMKDPTFVYEEGNEVCSDYIKVFLKINDQGLLEDFSYIGVVSNYHIASASLLAQNIVGKNIDEMLGLKINYLLDLGLEVKKSKYKHILFPLKSLRNAIHGYKKDGIVDEVTDLL